MKRKKVIYGGPRLLLVRAENGRYLSARYSGTPEVSVCETADGKVVLSVSRDRIRR